MNCHHSGRSRTPQKGFHGLNGRFDTEDGLLRVILDRSTCVSG
jgi:hypothetical protein